GLGRGTHDGLYTELEALLDTAGHGVGLQLLADELRRLVEHQVLREALERLPRRSHIAELKRSRVATIVSTGAHLDTLVAHTTLLTRRFPSAVSPTRRS